MKAFEQYKSYLPLGVSLLFFTLWAYLTYFNKPLVWDEIVSLTNFVLVPFSTTVTEYPDVNNHIFFNLVNNLFCKILSVKDLYDAMDKIALIRILPFLMSLTTIIYTWLIGKRFFNIQIANLAAFILVSTLPFLNFAMQLRGYTFSTTLLAVSVYHLLSYQENAKWTHLFISLFSVTALVYTIPSNAFYAISLGLLFFLSWLTNGLNLSKTKKKKGQSLSFAQQWIQNRYFLILCVLGLSAVLSYLLYLPILEDLLNERHLQQTKGQSFYSYNFQDLFPKFLYYMTSFRFLFALTTLLGLLGMIKMVRRFGWRGNVIYPSVFLFLLLMIPFIISFARGDKPPQRAFIPLSVSFALLAAVSLYYTLRDFKPVRKYPLMVTSMIIVYCLVSLQWSISNKDKVLHKAILDGTKWNSIMYNFYQSEDYGMERLDPLIKEAKTTGYPIIMANEIDRVSEGEYLHKHDLKYFSTVWSRQVPAKNDVGYQYMVLLEISQGKGVRPSYERINFPPSIEKQAGKFLPMFYFLMQNGVVDKADPKCYVLTYMPRWFEGVMKDYLTQFSYERISPKTSYHNIYTVKLKKPAGQ